MGNFFRCSSGKDNNVNHWMKTGRGSRAKPVPRLCQQRISLGWPKSWHFKGILSVASKPQNSHQVRSASGEFPSTPPSAHANSTNICPISIRRQMIYSMSSISVLYPICTQRSQSYSAAILRKWLEMTRILVQFSSFSMLNPVGEWGDAL